MSDSPGAQALRGQRVAFTGRLASMSREQAAAIVKEQGGSVVTTVSGRTSLLVVGLYGWPLRRDGGISVKVEQAERLRARGGRIRIVSEDVFAEMAGLRRREAIGRKAYSIEHVAEVVGVEPSVIATWEHLGLVRSDDRGDYDFQDIVSLQTIASLVHSGVRPEAIRTSLIHLSEVMPGTDRPLAQLHIVASDTGQLLAQVGESLVAIDGQHLFDFDRDAAATDDATTIEIKPVTALEDADALFARGVDLEDRERYEEAAAAYRAVIAREPARCEAYFNLGNVQRMMGRIEAAEELYRVSIAIEPTSELAWYNLADVLEEAGRVRESIECLRQAIEIEPTFADAHFNLAMCLEAVGDRSAAIAHWRRYLQLDPGSEWSRIARSHLAKL